MVTTAPVRRARAVTATADQIIQFVTCLFEPDDLIEIRRLPSGRSTWHPACALHEQSDALTGDNQAGQHIYVGVNPRSDHGRGADSVTTCRVLFADLDDTSVEDALERVEAADMPTATLALDSGHGCHCYWRLSEPIDPTTWSKWQRDLAALLGSDPSVHDAPRLTRLPGYVNHKLPAASCRIVQPCPDQRVDLADLHEVIPESGDHQPDPKHEWQARNGAAVASSDTLRRAAQYVERADTASKGERNSSALRLAAGLRRDFDLSGDEAWPLMRSWNRRNTPPLDDDELRTCVENGKRYGKNEIGAKLHPSKQGDNSTRAGSNRTRIESADTVPVIIRASSIAPRRVEWLWSGRFAIGKLSILVGDPGTGKSHLGVDIAARVSTGAPWPDNRSAPREPGSVVMLSGEDDADDTIVPRLIAARADTAKILILQGVTRTEDGPDGRLLTLSLERDLPALESAIMSAADAKLVIVDPLTCFLGGTDSHKNAAVRGLLAPLSEMASRLGVALVAITHLNKSAGGSALYRVMGSLAFCAAARSVWAVAKDKSNPSRRLFLGVKNNLARDTQGLAYSLINDPTHDVGVIAWEENPVTVSADEALAPTDRQDAADRTEHNQATEWLNKALAPGPMESKQVISEARANGISEKTLRRAQATLHIKPEKTSFDGPWTWSLPQDGQEPRLSNVAILGEIDHLRSERVPRQGGQPLSQKPQDKHNRAQDYQDGQHLKDGGIGQLGATQFVRTPG